MFVLRAITVGLTLLATTSPGYPETGPHFDSKGADIRLSAVLPERFGINYLLGSDVPLPPPSAGDRHPDLHIGTSWNLIPARENVVIQVHFQSSGAGSAQSCRGSLKVAGGDVPMALPLLYQLPVADVIHPAGRADLLQIGPADRAKAPCEGLLTLVVQAL